MLINIIVGWDAVITYQRIGKGQDLPSIRGVGYAFSITHHTSGKDDFAYFLCRISKTASKKKRAVFQKESGAIYSTRRRQHLLEPSTTFYQRYLRLAFAFANIFGGLVRLARLSPSVIFSVEAFG